MSIRNYHKFMGYENPNNQAPIVPVAKPSIAAGEIKSSTVKPEKRIVESQHKETNSCSLELF